MKRIGNIRLSAAFRKKAWKAAQGSISIFLVIILVPVISVAGLIVDASRYQLAQSEVSAAADLTMNSALADYDTVLKEVYGLFAMSQNNPEALQANLKQYFMKMLVNAGAAEDEAAVESSELLRDIVNIGSGEEADASNLLQMTIGDVSISGVEGSSLANPDVLKNQIVEFNKFRAPMNAAYSVLDGMKAISKVHQQSKVIEDSAKVDEAFQDLNEACKDLWDKAKKYEEEQGSNSDQLHYPDHYGDRTYEDCYRQTIVPAAVKSAMLESGDISISKSGNEGARTGYTMNFGVDMELKTLVMKDSKGNSMYVWTAARNGSKDELNAECEALYKCFNDWGNGVAEKLARALNQDFRNLSLADQTTYIDTYEQYMSYVYRMWRIESAYISKLSSDEAKEYKESNDFQKKQDVYEEASERADTMNLFRNDVRAELDEASNLVNGIREDYNYKINLYGTLDGYLSECISAANGIKNEIEKVNKKNEEFKTSLDKYGVDDAFAAKMKSAYEANKETVDADSLQEFIDWCNTLKSVLGSMKDYLQSFSVFGKKLSQYSNIDQIVDRFDYCTANGSGDSIRTVLSNGAASKSGNEVVDIVLGNGNFAHGSLNADNSNMSLSNTAFYQYLKATFSGGQDSDGSEETRDSIVQSGKDSTEGSTSSEGLGGDSISSMIGNSGGGSEQVGSIDAGGIKSDGFSSVLSNMSDITGSLTSGIEKALTGGRDNFYVLDYALNMFSWYTQEAEVAKEAQEKGGEAEPIETATGVPINASNNKIYKAEVEYILYGKDTAKQNVDSALTQIFALRFVCNSVYALTNSEIDAMTLTPALAIQAASGGVIPYKVPQVVMELALAMAESAVDMNDMTQGEGVPLFKSETTWRMSVYGGIDVAKDLAIEAAERTIDSASGNLKGALNSLIDAGAASANLKVRDLTDDLTDAANEQCKNAVDGVFGTFSESLQKSLDRVSSRIGNDAETIANSVIEEARSSAQAYIDKQADGALKSSLQKEFDVEMDALGTGAGGSLQGRIADAIRDLKNKEGATVDSVIKPLQNKVSEEIKGAIDRAKGSVQSAMETEISKMADSVKSQLGDKIDAANTKLNKKVAGEIDGWFAGTFGGVSESSKSTSASKGYSSCLKFKYSDYLRIFLFIKLCANSDDGINRIGDLIALNIKTAGDESDLKHKAGKSFSLAEAYTYCSMNATVTLKTMFLDYPLITKTMGVGDVSGFEVKYLGVQGY